MYKIVTCTSNVIDNFSIIESIINKIRKSTWFNKVTNLIGSSNLPEPSVLRILCVITRVWMTSKNVYNSINKPTYLFFVLCMSTE